jgi:hypothetical protein
MSVGDVGDAAPNHGSGFHKNYWRVRETGDRTSDMRNRDPFSVSTTNLDKKHEKSGFCLAMKGWSERSHFLDGRSRFRYEKPGFYSKSLLSGENYPRNPVSGLWFLVGLRKFEVGDRQCDRTRTETTGRSERVTEGLS